MIWTRIWIAGFIVRNVARSAQCRCILLLTKARIYIAAEEKAKDVLETEVYLVVTLSTKESLMVVVF